MTIRCLPAFPLVLLVAGTSLAVAAPAADAARPERRAPLVNIGDAAIAARAYHDSGAYARDVAAVDAQALAWIREAAPRIDRPAIVLDIDETSLSNYPAMIANNFGFFNGGACDALPQGPCGAMAWEQSGRDAAIMPTLALPRAAQALGVAVFFVTGRHESLREATAHNLTAAGYARWAGLMLEPDTMHPRSAADYKAPARAGIEAQGYHIIANIGDQPSDIAGGHAERSFLLPNPFYRIP